MASSIDTSAVSQEVAAFVADAERDTALAVKVFIETGRLRRKSEGRGRTAQAYWSSSGSVLVAVELESRATQPRVRCSSEVSERAYEAEDGATGSAFPISPCAVLR